jgi:hypothetical protein
MKWAAAPEFQLGDIGVMLVTETLPPSCTGT